jgi:hypothetical protein
MNEELERWKGKDCGLIGVLSENLPGDIQINHEILRIISVLTEIRTEQLPNISQQRYHLSQCAR